MFGKSSGRMGILFFLALLAVASFAFASVAGERQDSAGVLQQPPFLGDTLIAQVPKPDGKKPDGKKPDGKKPDGAIKSPSDGETAAEKKARIRKELLARMQENRLAGAKPMWGDFLGIMPGDSLVINGSGTQVPGGSGFPLSEGGSIAIRRMKLAENNSPLPVDRWIFGHNFFNDVRNVGDVNRYVFGIEKTYDEGLASIEIRFPFSSRLADVQSLNVAADEISSNRNTEAGDLSVIWKRVVAARGEVLTTAGLGLRIPTANDGRVMLAGNEVFRIEHQSLHLAPFVAMLGVRPEKKMFWQVFVQVDIPANGNPLTTQVTPTERETLGVLQDTTLLFADASMGYNWIEEREGLVKAVTPMLELHYASTLNEADSFSFQLGTVGFSVLDEALRYNILNLTAALDLKISDRLSVRPAMSFPLRTGSDRLYDFEAGIQVNLLR